MFTVKIFVVLANSYIHSKPEVTYIYICIYYSTMNINICISRFVVLGCVTFGTRLVFYGTDGVYMYMCKWVAGCVASCSGWKGRRDGWERPIWSHRKGEVDTESYRRLERASKQASEVHGTMEEPRLSFWDLSLSLSLWAISS